MKTATRLFPLMMVLFIIGMAARANAQGRGHHKSHDSKHGKVHRHDGPHERAHYRDTHRHHHLHRHEGRHVSHHQGDYCGHHPVVLHSRPRYVYYRDYGVYHDMHRNVYISWSGRNWTVSASMPVALRHVDVHHAVRMEVDYDHDDFDAYLKRGRPAYRRIFTGS